MMSRLDVSQLNIPLRPSSKTDLTHSARTPDTLAPGMSSQHGRSTHGSPRLYPSQSKASSPCDSVTAIPAGYSSFAPEQCDSIRQIAVSAVQTGFVTSMEPLFRSCIASAIASTISSETFKHDVAQFLDVAVREALRRHLSDSPRHAISQKFQLDGSGATNYDVEDGIKSSLGRDRTSNNSDRMHSGPGATDERSAGQSKSEAPLGVAEPEINVYDFQALAPRLIYRTDWPRLPARTPREHPHIISISNRIPDTLLSGIGFADLVATILYMWDPEVLSSFLDSSKQKFDFTWTRRDQGKTAYMQGLPFVTVGSAGASGIYAVRIERRVKFVTVILLPRLDQSHKNYTSCTSKCLSSFPREALSKQERVTYRIVHETTGRWVPISASGPDYGQIRGARAIDRYMRSYFIRRVLDLRIWDAGKGGKESLNGSVRVKIR